MSKSRRSLKDLEERIKSARARRALRGGPDKSKEDSQGDFAKGMAIAGRILAEFIAAIAVGVGLGLWLDSIMDTKPLMLILGIVLGWGGAVLNIIRTVKELERKALPASDKTVQGRSKPASSQEDEDEDW